jgi:hypothetical protein
MDNGFGVVDRNGVRLPLSPELSGDPLSASQLLQIVEYPAIPSGSDANWVAGEVELVRGARFRLARPSRGRVHPRPARGWRSWTRRSTSRGSPALDQMDRVTGAFGVRGSAFCGIDPQRWQRAGDSHLGGQAAQ